MFIAVTKKIFSWFEKGKKYELRAVRKRFTTRTVKIGMKITIGEGYSGRRFRARVVDVIFKPNIESVFKAVPFRKINPFARNKKEAICMAKETCGKGNAYVAIGLKKI